MLTALQTIALVIAGLMVGNELTVSVFVHPQLCKLDDKLHVTAAQAFARIYGAIMPFWYALTLVLTIAIALLLRQSGVAFLLAIISVILWSVSILLTIAKLVPINSQISRWNVERLPHNWRQMRQQWDRLHRVRVMILSTALVCLTVACITG